MIIELKSVGCGIDTETLNTYPQNVDGTYDTNEGVITHIDECSDEWLTSLSDVDFDTISSLLTQRIKNTIKQLNNLSC